MSIVRVGMAGAIALLVATGPLGAQIVKVGYVNSQDVLAEYPAAQEARAALETVRRDSESEVQLLSSGLQAEIGQYQQQQMTLTADARQAREQELAERQQALQRRTQELTMQFEQRQAEILQPVMEEITAVIEEIRVEGGYSLILDTASQAILAADPALDLTQEVLSRLEAKQGADGGS